MKKQIPPLTDKDIKSIANSISDLIKKTSAYTKNAEEFKAFYLNPINVEERKEKNARKVSLKIQVAKKEAEYINVLKQSFYEDGRTRTFEDGGPSEEQIEKVKNELEQLRSKMNK